MKHIYALIVALLALVYPSANPARSLATTPPSPASVADQGGAYLVNYRFLGVTGASNAVGYFVDSAGRRLAAIASHVVNVADGSNSPKSFDDLWTTLPTGAVGWIGSFSSSVYYDTGSDSDFKSNYASGYKTIPAGTTVCLGRIDWPVPLDPTVARPYLRSVSDTFVRPSNTTAYAANDRLSATTSDTGTTVLRSLDLARVAGEPFRIRFVRLTSNSTTFLPRIRVHLYSVAAPSTAIPGDNAAYPILYANAPQRIGYFDLPALTLPGGSGSDSSSTSLGQLNELDFLVAPAAADTKIYYALEVLDAATPASGQSFTLDVRVSE